MVTVRRLVADQSGATAAEFGLVLVVLIPLLFSILDAGRYMWSINRAEKAVQRGARTAVVTNAIAPQIVTTNYVSRTAGSGGAVLTQGDRIPAAALDLITCTSSACVCQTATAASCPSTTALAYDDTGAYNRILGEMQGLLPNVVAGNVTVEYRGSGLGFAGDPNGSDIMPLVTVKLSGVQMPLLFTLTFANLTLPTVTATLPAEDLAGNTSF